MKLRRSQLQKMRALLFYQEQKHKRIKKIKSKMFRKIRKKKRDKHENEVREHIRVTNPELAKELDEKDLKKRGKTRSKDNIFIQKKNILYTDRGCYFW